jgi:hypothetical protein
MPGSRSKAAGGKALVIHAFLEANCHLTKDLDPDAKISV